MWLEEAKKRAEESAPDAPWSIEKAIPFLDPLERIAWGDAPCAYALLERAKVLMDHHIYVCEVHNLSEGVTEVEDFLRDLEGKEETDAGTDT